MKYCGLGQYQKSLNVFDQAVQEFAENRFLKVLRTLTAHNIGKFEESFMLDDD